MIHFFNLMEKTKLWARQTDHCHQELGVREGLTLRGKGRLSAVTEMFLLETL